MSTRSPRGRSRTLPLPSRDLGCGSKAVARTGCNGGHERRTTRPAGEARTVAHNARERSRIDQRLARIAGGACRPGRPVGRSGGTGGTGRPRRTCRPAAGPVAPVAPVAPLVPSRLRLPWGRHSPPRRSARSNPRDPAVQRRLSARRVPSDPEVPVDPRHQPSRSGPVDPSVRSAIRAASACRRTSRAPRRSGRCACTARTARRARETWATVRRQGAAIDVLTQLIA